MEHVELLRSFMEVQGVSSTILCRGFPLTLSRAARRWFRKLRPNSISSFNELIREFTMHFRSARQRGKLVTYLLTVKQHESESLKEYIQRYNVETTQVDGYDDEVAFSELMEGLHMGRLWWSVAKNPPSTYSEIFSWAEKYANAKERFQSKKWQEVADFVADFTKVKTPHSEVLGEQSKQWTFYIDGAFNNKGSVGGLIVITPDKTEIGCALQFGFDATNNEIEYEALLAGFRLVQALGVKNLLIFSDSQLVVNQINCNYEVRDLNIIAYLERVNELLKDFERFEIRQIPQEQNQRADALAQLASTLEGNLLRSVPIATIPKPSILQVEVKEVVTIDRRAIWMERIEKYLINRELPVDKNEARKVRLTAARYLFIDGELYKRGFSLHFLKCLAPADANYVPHPRIQF